MKKKLKREKDEKAELAKNKDEGGVFTMTATDAREEHISRLERQVAALERELGSLRAENGALRQD